MDFSSSAPKRIYVEVVSKKNPISFEFPNSNILNMELISFYYDQGASDTIKMLGLIMPGARGHYNEALVENTCLKTIYSKEGKFDYKSDDVEAPDTFNQGNHVDLGFISRDGGSLVNPNDAQPIAFANNYLLNIAFEVERR